MNKLFIISLLSILLTLTASASFAKPDIQRTLPCNNQDIATACNVRNPEDLVYFSKTNEILFSQFGGIRTMLSGYISALNPDTMAPYNLKIIFDNRENWGDKSCIAPAKLSPHGIDLSQRKDGRWQLLVVNHYWHESVEIYELSRMNDKTQLLWRGCVQGDEFSAFNDVVAIPSTSGFLVSHMMPSRNTWQGKIALIKALFGLNTGFVYEWQANKMQLVKVPNTDASLANGILLSKDENTIYLNSYFSNELIAINRKTGEREIIANVAHPDNSTWAANGHIIVASHLGKTLEIVSCDVQTGDKNCVVPFQIISINPDTKKSKVLHHHTQQLIPIATTGLIVNQHLFLGTYSGNRVSRINLSP